MLLFQDFATWVRQQAAAVQSSARVVLDLTVGSVLRAVLEANASVALWMQWLILLVLQRSRLATSTAADVDTFVGDYGFVRQAATAASGPVTFARATTGQAAFIPVGAQVKTIDGSQTFTVFADASNAAFSLSLGGYSVATGTASVSVPVAAVTLGTAGNIQAGAIGLLATAVPGIDTVTNAAPFANALDAETDAAVRTRFRLFIASLASAVPSAINAAALGVQQGVRIQNVPNTPRVGFYTLYADDGSGAAPDSFIAAVAVAVQAVSAEGVTPVVMRPSLVAASIQVALTPSANAIRQAVDANVAAALAAFIVALPIGGTLPYLQLANVIFAADPGVAKINLLTVNGAMADLVAPVGSVVQATSITVA